MSTENITESTLGQFYGSENFYRHGLLRGLVLTDGVQYLNTNGAGWLVDAIASYQVKPSVRKEEFQSWTLTVDLDKKSAVLRGTDGNEKTLARQRIDYTDFPLPEVKFFACHNELGGITLMLSSEY